MYTDCKTPILAVLHWYICLYYTYTCCFTPGHCLCDDNTSCTTPILNELHLNTFCMTPVLAGLHLHTCVYYTDILHMYTVCATLILILILHQYLPYYTWTYVCTTPILAALNLHTIIYILHLYTSLYYTVTDDCCTTLVYCLNDTDTCYNTPVHMSV